MKWKGLCAVALGAATLFGGMAPATAQSDAVAEGAWFKITRQLPGHVGMSDLWVQNVGGKAVWQGDVTFGSVEEAQRPPRAESGTVGGTWTGGKIPYFFTNGTTPGLTVMTQAQKDVFQNAVNHWNSVFVNLKWVPRTNADQAWVVVGGFEEASPPCGRVNGGLGKPASGARELQMGDPDDCGDLSTALHEMLHAAGASHEMSRSDRDNYIKINWSYIENDPNGDDDTSDSVRPQFYVNTASKSWAMTGYDFNSTMNYETWRGLDDDAPEGAVTMVGKNGQAITRGTLPTSRDIAGMEQAHSPLTYVFPASTKKDFGSNTATKYSSAKHVRLVTDMNGDNKADALVFGDNGVIMAANNGSGGFLANRNISSAFGWNQNWKLETTERLVGNVAGTALPELIGFGSAGVYVVRNYGNNEWSSAGLATTEFDQDSGWDKAKHERQLWDVNGDGFQDIVGFGNVGTHVALSKGDGTFHPAVLGISQFGYDQSWRVGKHVRTLADMDGDNKLDIVGFGEKGVWMSKGIGTGRFRTRELKIENYGSQQGYNGPDYPRFVADMNGDGKKDVVAFGSAGVYVSFQNPTGFTFAAPTLAAADMGYSQGWRAAEHDRYVTDLNGDGKQDLVGFGNFGLQGVLQTSNGAFSPPRRFLAWFGATGGWGKDMTDPGGNFDQPRFLADLNGDGKQDPGAFGSLGVWTVGTGAGTGLG